MKIEYKEIYGLDVYIKIKLKQGVDAENIKTIRTCIQAWLTLAFHGSFDGLMHRYSEIEYEEEDNYLVVESDIGSMNPVEGFKMLEQVCEGCNWALKKEAITSIVISTLDDE